MTSLTSDSDLFGGRVCKKRNWLKFRLTQKEKSKDLNKNCANLFFISGIEEIILQELD